MRERCSFAHSGAAKKCRLVDGCLQPRRLHCSALFSRQGAFYSLNGQHRGSLQDRELLHVSRAAPPTRRGMLQHVRAFSDADVESQEAPQPAGKLKVIGEC